MILSPDQLKAIGKGEFERDLTLAATRKPWPKLIPYDLYGLSMNSKLLEVCCNSNPVIYKQTKSRVKV